VNARLYDGKTASNRQFMGFLQDTLAQISARTVVVGIRAGDKDSLIKELQLPGGSKPALRVQGATEKQHPENDRLH
jgi:hypothetical protein